MDARTPNTSDIFRTARRGPLAGATRFNPLDSDPLARVPEVWVESLYSDIRFRIVTETMVDGLIVIDGNGMIQYVNPGCEKLFGYPEDVLVGQNVSRLMPERFAQQHDGYLARHRESRVKRIIGIGRELTGLRADGTEFPMYLSVGESRIDGQTAFVGVIYDLTEKKRSEELLLHHQKLDAIGQLCGGVAHDFNNILSIISGNLEMIARHELPPSAQRAIARANDAAVRAARITQRLLAFARRQPLAPQTLSLNDVIEDLSDLLRRSLGPGVELNLALSEDAALVDTDMDQFETAILNLALNARDAMPSGGLLRIETENVEYTEEPRSTDEVPPGQYVRVSVSDNGAGMSPEVRARAVEPFFTTKPASGGTGLGLSMVYGFLKQIGGHARIYSEEGLGTRVSLFFPRSSSARPDVVQPAPEAPVPRGQEERILVVEDDPDVRHVTVSRLEDLGYTTVVAIDAPTALAAVQANPGLHAGLLDVVIPGGMDGHALADAIAALNPRMRLILMSGYSPRMAHGDGLHPDRPFLTKPVSRQKLASVLRQELDRA